MIETTCEHSASVRAFLDVLVDQHGKRDEWHPPAPDLEIRMHTRDYTALWEGIMRRFDEGTQDTYTTHTLNMTEPTEWRVRLIEGWPPFRADYAGYEIVIDDAFEAPAMVPKTDGRPVE